MPSISNIFQGLLSWHRKLQFIEVAKQLQNSSMTAINGHRRRAKPAENVRKKEKKNIRETIKLIDSNLYATKENLRHQKGENWHCESFSEQQKENRRESSRGEV